MAPSNVQLCARDPPHRRVCRCGFELCSQECIGEGPIVGGIVPTDEARSTPPQMCRTPQSESCSPHGFASPRTEAQCQWLKNIPGVRQTSAQESVEQPTSCPGTPKGMRVTRYTVEFLPLGRASWSLGAPYTSRRFLGLGRDTRETLASSCTSSQEARKFVEIESRD